MVKEREREQAQIESCLKILVTVYYTYTYIYIYILMLFSMSTVTRPTRPRPLTLPQIETGRAEAKFSSAKCSEPVPVWAINQHSTAWLSAAGSWNEARGMLIWHMSHDHELSVYLVGPWCAVRCFELVSNRCVVFVPLSTISSLALPLPQ